MDLELTGRTVLITGASGGIGRALARAFAAEGCNLALHGFRNMDGLRELIRNEGWRDRALALRADITDADAVDAMFEEAAGTFGRVDVCVANAGRWPSPPSLLGDMSPGRFRDTIDVNLCGAAWTARSFLRRLITDDAFGAALTFIGSTAGRFGEAGHSDYAAGKSALRGLMLSLKNEVVRRVPLARCNMVEPGWTVTEMTRDALDDPGKISRIARTMSLRQLARAGDIASCVVMLSSPAVSRHITGEVITVSGGMEGRMLWADEDVDPGEIRGRS